MSARSNTGTGSEGLASADSWKTGEFAEETGVAEPIGARSPRLAPASESALPVRTARSGGGESSYANFPGDLPGIGIRFA